VSRWYTCDTCGESQVEPMVYELSQITDDGDDLVVRMFHLCSSKCLCGFAMDLAMDFPDVDEPALPDEGA
jgi:hypothetical protein